MLKRTVKRNHKAMKKKPVEDPSQIESKGSMRQLNNGEKIITLCLTSVKIWIELSIEKSCSMRIRRWHEMDV